MQYLALYRKYRPQRFEELVGQDVVTQTLKNAVASGRTSHAYLFCGPRGTGKTSAAKILARAVNCEHPQQGEPCGTCPACLALSGATAADIFEFDAASNSRVEQMRDLLDKVMYPPTVGTRRVYILDEVHMLSPAAFNALLKTLEEPPGFAMFILATTEPHRLPATIVSRCQRFDFRRIDTACIAARLRHVLADAGADVAPEAIELIARLSEGGLRDALSLADQVINTVQGRVEADDVARITGGANQTFLARISGLLLDGELGGALETLDQALSDGADAAMLARDLARYLRDMLIAVSVEHPGAFLRLDDAAITQLCQLGRHASRSVLTHALSILTALDGTMRYALSPRVCLETALAQIALGPESGDDAVASLQHRIDTLERKLQAGGAPSAAAPQDAISPTQALAAENFPTPAAKAPSQSPKKRAAADGEPSFKTVLERVKRERISLYPALGKADCRVEGNVITLRYEKGDDIYAGVTKKEANLAFLQQIAAQVYPQPMQIQIVIDAGDGFDPKQAQNRAQALFGDKLTLR